MAAVRELREFLRFRGLQLVTLAALLAVVGWRSFRLKFCVLDLDIWWHLKVGDWIVQHLSVPHSGILSRTAANRPWVAYSWGYEVMLSRAYAWLGLLGIGAFGTLLTIAIAFAVYCMARRLSGRFWVSCLLAATTCSAFLFDMMPRPGFLSIVLFTVTLTLILNAQRSGELRTLYWLPLVFLCWANLHIQFIYGLFLVGLLLGVNLVERGAARLGMESSFLAPPKLPARALAAVFGACVIATLIGPNFYHLYGVIASYSRAKVAYSAIIELQPLSFRAYSNYVELLLAGAAFYAVGWQKKIDLFKLALLVIGSVVAFRTMRDAWFLCIPAAACLADTTVEGSERESPETPFELAGVFAMAALAMLLFARDTEFTTRGLDRAITGTFPVKAVNFLRRNPQPGPLYNTFDWGGFLMWYMPQYPVAIDGRNDLYGDELDGRFFRTQSGDLSYKTDPSLNESGVILLRKTDGLVYSLNLDPNFRKIYEDELAALFVRR
ncbi:MAG: hypothetical protein ACHP8B_18815 [Terriglobales bacterium]